MRSRHSRNSLKASLAEFSAQRKRWKNKYAKIQERRQRKGKKSSDENNDNAGSIHDATKRFKTRGKGHDGSYNSGVPNLHCSSVCEERGQTTPADIGFTGSFYVEQENGQHRTETKFQWALPGAT